MKKLAIISAITLLTTVSGFIYYANIPKPQPTVNYGKYDPAPKTSSETTGTLIKAAPTPEPTPVPVYEPAVVENPVVARSFDELTAINFPESAFITAHGDFGHNIYIAFIQRWGTYKLIYPSNFTPDRIEQTFANIKPVFDATMGTAPGTISGVMSQYLYDHQ